MEILVAYGFMVLLAAVAVWQAVCVVVWLWDKVRKPVERTEAPEPDAVQRGLERIVQDMERREENGKSA